MLFFNRAISYDRTKRFVAIAAVFAVFGPFLGSARLPAQQRRSAPLPEKAVKRGPVRRDAKAAPRPASVADVRASSFQGVTPGETSTQELQRMLGKPRSQYAAKGAKVLVYQLGPFRKVEFATQGGRVASITIELKDLRPPAQVAKELGIERYAPVEVFNGDKAVGRAFPERCVVISYENAGEPKARRIILDAVSADPFILRAKAIRPKQIGKALQDLRIAQRIAPQEPHAFWLEADLQLQLDRPHAAVTAAGRALGMARDETRFQITDAIARGKLGEVEVAIELLERTAQSAKVPKPLRLEAYYGLGELYRASRLVNYPQAVKYFTAAIAMAKPLASAADPVVSRAARRTLLDCHHRVAFCIAWGSWQNKSAVVPKWLANADLLIKAIQKNDAGDESLAVVHNRWKLWCLAGSKSQADPSQLLQQTIELGRKLAGQISDPLQRAILEREIGASAHAGMLIELHRGRLPQAVQMGQDANALLSDNAALEKGFGPQHDQLARLYFELGGVIARGKNEHDGAMTWFRKAIPLMQHERSRLYAADIGLVGEQLVSMGVSAWYSGSRKQAVQVTAHGIKWMEEAVAKGKLKSSHLAVPYENLSQMQQKLGNAEEARILAGRAKAVQTERR